MLITRIMMFCLSCRHEYQKIVSVVIFIFLLLLQISFNISFAQMLVSQVQLQAGDLLFQDLNCGELCDGINKVTRGINGAKLSHVGMVINVTKTQVTIVEAYSNRVSEISLSDFLNRSKDRQAHPRVIVGRLTIAYQALVPAAIAFAKKQLAKPYNETFVQNGKSYYCSELIYAAFKHANQGVPIFTLSPMNFKDPVNQQFLPEWKIYFDKLQMQPPQGQLGSNPGRMSTEKNIRIVYKYGEVRDE